jgi:hypothetical protein
VEEGKEGTKLKKRIVEVKKKLKVQAFWFHRNGLG